MFLPIGLLISNRLAKVWNTPESNVFEIYDYY